MSFLFHLFKKYPFSDVCILLIWILSLVPFFPETPLDNVEFIDKWVHIVMYGGTFLVLWIEYTVKHLSPDYEKLFFWGWLMPIIMGGVIELLQEYCTGGHRCHAGSRYRTADSPSFGQVLKGYFRSCEL